MVDVTPEYIADADAGKSIASPGIRRRFNHMGQMLVSLGFQREPAVGFMKFTKMVDGRMVTLTAGARSKNKYMHPDISRRCHTGMILVIQIQTSVKTRLMFTSSTSRMRWLIKLLQRFNGNTRLSTSHSIYNGYHIWVSESDWAEAFLQNSDVQDNIRGLLGSDHRYRHLLNWAPGICNFTPAKVPSNLSKEMIAGWLHRLQAVVALAEQNPPQNEAPLNWLERQSGNGRLPMIIAVLLLAVPMLILAGLGSFFFLVVLLLSL